MPLGDRPPQGTLSVSAGPPYISPACSNRDKLASRLQVLIEKEPSPLAAMNEMRAADAMVSTTHVGGRRRAYTPMPK